MSIPHRHADPAQIAATERTFFVTASTWGKRSLLQTNRAAELFIRTLRDYRRQQKYLLHEFVVMPDHFHALITVAPGMTVERAVQFVKGGFAFRAGKALGFKAPVWQKGFSEIRVFEWEAFENQTKYIWNNPVVAYLAERAEDYAHSSARDRAELDPPPLRLKPVHLEELCSR